MTAVVLCMRPHAHSAALIAALEAGLGRVVVADRRADAVRRCREEPRSVLVMDLRAADEDDLAEARRARLELVGTRVLALVPQDGRPPPDCDAVMGDGAFLADVVAWCARALEAPIGEGQLAELAAGLTHEIGNPLTALMLQLDILADHDGLDGLGPEVERLRGTTRRIQQVIRDFAAAYDRSPVSAAPTTLGALVEDALTRLAERDESLVSRLHVHCSDAPLPADGDLIGAALADLWHYLALADEDGGDLAVEAARADDVMLRLRTVADAKRLPPHAAASLFTPLWARQALGLPDEIGLSLSSARAAFRRHGGELRARRDRRGRLTVDGLLPATDGG